MIKQLLINKILFIATGILSLVASIIGVLNPAIYDPVVSDWIKPGMFTQDLIVIMAAIVMIVLSISMQPRDYRKTIVILGILGFLFYAYGIYAIEQIYTKLYPLYLAILTLGFYVSAYTLANVEHPRIEQLELSPILRYGAAAYGILIAVMFNIIWIGQLFPLIETGDRIEYTFSVYIIDLVFIMPAFVISAVLLIRKHAIGIVGIPALFVLGLCILSPLALAEVLKPWRYGTPMALGDFWLFGILSLIFLVLAIIYLAGLRTMRQVE